MNKSILFGLGGSAVFIIGVFLPSLTVVNKDIIFILHSPISGVALISLSIATIFIIFKNEQGKRVLHCGIISVIVILVSIIVTSVIKNMLTDQAVDDQIAQGVIDAMIGNFTGITWGWLFIIGGPLMIIYAGLQPQTATNRPNKDINSEESREMLRKEIAELKNEISEIKEARKNK